MTYSSITWRTAGSGRTGVEVAVAAAVVGGPVVAAEGGGVWVALASEVVLAEGAVSCLSPAPQEITSNASSPGNTPRNVRLTTDDHAPRPLTDARR